MLRSVNESVCDEGQDRTTEMWANDAPSSGGGCRTEGQTKGNVLLQQKGGGSRKD